MKKKLITLIFLTIPLAWTILLTWVLVDCSIELFMQWPMVVLPLSVKVMLLFVIHVVMIVLWVIGGLLLPSSFINAFLDTINNKKS